MGTYAAPSDVESMYYSAVNSGLVIINDLGSETVEEKQRLAELITVKFGNNNHIDIIPKCNCPDGSEHQLRGIYYKGMRCPACNSVVSNHLGEDLKYEAWIVAPEGIDSFMLPLLWMMLRNVKAFKVGGFDFVMYLADRSYQPNCLPPTALALVEEKMQELNMERGWNGFIRNFETALQILLSLGENKSKRQRVFEFKYVADEPLWIFYHTFKHLLFPKMLPLPNRAASVIEETNFGFLQEDNVTDICDVAQTMAAIEQSSIGDRKYAKEPSKKATVGKKEVRIVKVMNGLYNYYDHYLNTHIRPKLGVIRKGVVGWRDNFSNRNVIVSRTDIHRYDSLVMPWTSANVVMKYHVLNHLIRIANFSPNELLQLHLWATINYDELFYKILKKIIADSPGGRYWTLIHRNPLLTTASAQLQGVDDVCKDPRVQAIWFSILATVGANADFDGDELNMLLMNTTRLLQEFENFRPHHSAFSVTDYKMQSRFISKPKPVLANLSAHFDRMKKETPDPVKLAKMSVLPEVT